ncbi:TPA: Rha family transcriptional regulator [Enterobacter hormaechei]|nr:Rha family transcriptional regulator [Enterobacter hormaechei]HCU2364986.1 Rha family transcriptional regulator [Enterobacter hormaechei]
MFEIASLTPTTGIHAKPSMTSLEIAELVGSRHDSVKRTIERLAKSGVIASPPTVEKPTAGRPVTIYLFENEQGKRDSIIVVAQLSPEFTARLVDRWKELETLYADRVTPAIPHTYKEALVHLLRQVEENERLDKENEALGVALSHAKPKAILMDTICGAADELYGLNEAGRILGTSGAVLGALMDSLGDVYVKRKYTTTNRQFLKIFIDRGYGKNVVSGNGHNQAKYTFKGLCFAAVKLIAAGKISVSAIEYEPCRVHVEREMEETTPLH